MLRELDLQPGMLSEFARGDFVKKYLPKMGDYGKALGNAEANPLRHAAIKKDLGEFMRVKEDMTLSPSIAVPDAMHMQKLRQRIARAIKKHRREN